jgi:hypothetical protein
MFLTGSGSEDSDFLPTEHTEDTEKFLKTGKAALSFFFRVIRVFRGKSSLTAVDRMRGIVP